MSDIDVAQVINSTDEKREAVGLEALNLPQRVVTLLSHARFEYDMGGLGGFFYNSTSDFADETSWALEEIGAPKTASLLRLAKILFFIDGNINFANWDEALSSVSSKKDRDYLEEEFSQTWSKERPDESLEDYALANIASLQDQ